MNPMIGRAVLLLALLAAGPGDNPWELVLIARDGALVVPPGLEKAEWKALPETFGKGGRWQGTFEIEGRYYVLGAIEGGLQGAFLSFATREWVSWEDRSLEPGWCHRNDQQELIAQRLRDDEITEWRASVGKDLKLTWVLVRQERLPKERFEGQGGFRGACGCIDSDWDEVGSFHDEGLKCTILRHRRDGASFKITRWEGEPRHSKGEDLAAFTIEDGAREPGRPRFVATSHWINGKGGREFLLNRITATDDVHNPRHRLYHVAAGKPAATPFFPGLWKDRVVVAAYRNAPR